jgi:tRNA (cmo5U34)-methyltransferase
LTEPPTLAAGQEHWDPSTYLALMAREVPAYERLQQAAIEASGDEAKRVLELGVGSGETARRVLARHPRARLVGIDASPAMLAAARVALPAQRVELRRGRLEDALPAGPFDLVISALAVHHLEGPAKADLFGRVAKVLATGGRFVLADLVVPENPLDAVSPLDAGYDKPSTLADQLAWLVQAGLEPAVSWREGDLAVLVAV